MSGPEHVLLKHAPFSNLPPELIETLNQTYFLHLLVTEPHKVIPPGKSLLSMMTHANFKASDITPKQDKREQIENRVKEVAHRAFWNETRVFNPCHLQALESLSSPLPPVQLPRLRQLYLDLHEGLAPLFPPNHQIIVSLSSPLPPTSSPLLSTVNFLVEIVTALRQRCAPIRDQAIDDLLSALEHSRQGSTDSVTPVSTTLAEFVIETLKAILSLAESMKADLNTFVLGSMTEAQLQGVLLNDVKVRERELVLNVWGGKDIVRGQWRTWISETSSGTSEGTDEKKCIKRLFRALGSDQPIHCMLPSTTPVSYTNGTKPPTELDNRPLELKVSELPPQLFFSTPSFLYVQNCLQAIVISASLLSLTRLSAPTPSRNTILPGSTTGDAPCSEDHDFMTRIWTLLKAEIDDDTDQRNTGSEAGTESTGHTKLINLADEVVRARQQCLAGSSSPILSVDEEKRLRDAVERTLRSTDPVFQLLKKRLMNALEKRIIFLASSGASDNPDAQSIQSIPTKMQTGKNPIEERAGKRPRLVLPESMLPSNQTSSLGKEAGVSMGTTIPGFEDSVLQQAIVEVLQKIVGCVYWVEGVWGDLV
ncbi:hypothetical protein CVT25_003024 [Psilocybe cyanescens]|uniref:Uncharacterized protein n=1 Tax=Psilocybe cyanescens TaxID=93625 RepID=A0A409WN80_PSICY|nr:hypothetical protein CVT25_003024 [Psilocybe cyanescens]